jgi:hypothetical protein
MSACGLYRASTAVTAVAHARLATRGVSNVLSSSQPGRLQA